MTAPLANTAPVPHADLLLNVLKPIEEATGLPNAFYTDEAYFRVERDTLMADNWACIGFIRDLPAGGHAKPVDFMGLPLLVTRNRDDDIQVFHNVCSHRGMKLVHEAGEIRGVIRCPYHSWTYDLDGNLKGTPHVGGVNQHKDPRFACEKHGLKAIRSEVWMDMLFVNLSGNAPAFSEMLQPLTERFEQFLSTTGLSLLRTPANGSTLSIEVNCNWKLAVENYCEAYHLPWVHPALNSYSRLEDHYNIQFAGRFAGQGSHAYNLADVEGITLPTFPAWPQNRQRTAEYFALFPNVLLGIQADHVFAMVLEPLAINRTAEHLQLYFVGEAALEDQYAASHAAVLNAWRIVFAEDISAVEGMQAGRQSPGFRGGVFSPEMDVPTHYFHQWVARQLI